MVKKDLKQFSKKKNGDNIPKGKFNNKKQLNKTRTEISEASDSKDTTKKQALNKPTSKKQTDEKINIFDSLTENNEGNNADFYVDDADLLESDAEGDDFEAEKNGDSLSNSLDGSDLDFDDEDYVESESEGSKDELKKKAKTVSKEELAKLLKNCLTGNNYYITKIIQLFTKINSNKVETMDEEHVLNIPKYTNKLIKFYIKELPGILVMKLNNVNLMDKNASIGGLNLKANEFGLEGDSESDSVAPQQSGAAGASNAKALVKRYLSVLSKYIKNAEISQRGFIFRNLCNCADLVILFTNYTEMYLKFFIKAWAAEIGSDASFTSLQTVKRILSKKPQMFEIVLKLMYINYLEFAKANSWQTLRRIKDMQDDIIGILSYDLQKAYITIFTFIRKLCIQLRITVTEKRAASIKSIYNWQFINSLILWTNAVCKYAQEPFNDIKLLAYPLIQTIIGVIRLNLVDVFFPLRIVLVNLLNKISLETEIFIPCENYILEILESSNFSKPFKNKILNENENGIDSNNNNPNEDGNSNNTKINKKNKNGKNNNVQENKNKLKLRYEKFDLNINLKVKKETYSNYGNVIYLLDEALDSLIEFCGVNCFKISFPELGLIVVNYLRKISKNMMDKFIREKVKATIEKIQENIDLMEEIRQKKEYCLTDLEKISMFERKLKNSKKLPLHVLLDKVYKKREDHIIAKIYKMEDKFIEV